MLCPSLNHSYFWVFYNKFYEQCYSEHFCLGFLFAYAYVFLEFIPRSEIALLWSMHVFNLTVCYQNIFQSGDASLYSQYLSIPVVTSALDT